MQQKRFLLPITLTLLLSQVSTYALDFDPDRESFEEEEFDSFDIDSLNLEASNNEEDDEEDEENEEIPSSKTMPPHIVQLKKGSLLQDLKTKKFIQIYRPLITKVQENSQRPHTLYVLDKNNQRRFTTKLTNAIDIRNEIKLYPQVNPLLVYNDKQSYRSTNHPLKFESYFNAQSSLQSTNYYADLFEGKKTKASEINFMAKTYISLEDFPLDFGVALQYSIGNWEDKESESNLKWHSLNYGPAFKYSFKKKKDSRWNLHLSILKSIYQNSDYGLQKYKFSTLGTQIEMEREFISSYGKWGVGLKYALSSSSLKSNGQDLKNSTQRGSFQSIGTFISYHFNWKL